MTWSEVVIDKSLQQLQLGADCACYATAVLGSGAYDPGHFAGDGVWPAAS
jgi:hypothetical protein